MSIGPFAAPPALWTTRPPMSSEPVSSKIVSGAIRPSSSAAVAAVGFDGEAAGEALRPQGRLAHLLQAGVEGQPEVVAGPRRPVGELTPGTPQRVDLDPLTAGGTAEEAVVGVLDP